MVEDLNMNLDVVVMPTVREADGLAMSSRNVYLSPSERAAALVIPRAIRLAQNLWEGGERNASLIRSQVRQLIEAEPLARIEYVSVARNSDLDELTEIQDEALVSLAVRVGSTRLIDNIVLGKP
jgi:pantoate--beta-alanine ligase